jgi:nuclear protein localization family protein 4
VLPQPALPEVPAPPSSLPPPPPTARRSPLKPRPPRRRDGLERVEVPDGASVADLRAAIAAALGVADDAGMQLSREPALLTAADARAAAAAAADLAAAHDAPLSELGLAHGALLHLRYPGARAAPPPALPAHLRRPFGAHATVASMVAAQTRVERQDVAPAALLSLDADAANGFQSYVQGALGFSIKRGGILYGTVEELPEEMAEAGDGAGGEKAGGASGSGGAGVLGSGQRGTFGAADDAPKRKQYKVYAHAIFEPPQEGSKDALRLERGGPDEAAADALAAALGWRKVGWVYTLPAGEREFIASTEEVCGMAAAQAELGEWAVTAVAAQFASETEGAPPEVHFEAFQVRVFIYYCAAYSSFIINLLIICSENVLLWPLTTHFPPTPQVSNVCVRLFREGWFADAASPGGASALRDPRDPKAKAPVIVAGKDASEVDNDYFLIPVAIADHAAPLSSAFPVENRLLPQGGAELRAHLARRRAAPYAERLADFHLLLWLARQPGIEAADAAAIAAAARDRGELAEGYRLIVDALAGM